jgi:hypothetical protein
MSTVIRGLPVPSSNGNGKPQKPKPLTREQQLKRVLRAPTKGYQGTGAGWWGFGTQALDGRPVFTWLDIPRMMTDSKVIFISLLWRAPFQKVEFTVKGSSPKVATFVQNTIKRFWRSSLPALLSRFFEYGYAPGGAEYTAIRGKLRLDEVKAIECRDARPRVFASGSRKGDFAGFDLTNAHAPGTQSAQSFVSSPHAFWFAGGRRISHFFDRPPLAGLFEPWLRKNGRGGAVQRAELWFRKHSARGMEVRYPPGTSQMGTDENPQEMDNLDIARGIADYHETNSTLCLENTREPGDSGEYEWTVKYAEAQGDVAGFLEQIDKLDAAMVEGAGIPLEVIQGSDSGSGYKGRLVSYGGHLGTVDELTGLILKACDPWLLPLVHWNYGPDAWYEIEAISLAKIASEEEKRQPTNPVGQPLASLPGGGGSSPPAGGGAPFQLSTLDDEWGDDLDDEYTGDPVVLRFGLDTEPVWISGGPSQPVELSTVTPIPVVPVAAPPSDNSAVLGAIQSLGNAILATLKAKEPVPASAPLQLSATVTSDPTAERTKQTAFQQTQSRLLRVRKSALAQLLALAMLRKQQEATASGHPEDAAGSLEALANLASDPMQVARIVGMQREMSSLEMPLKADLELSWTQAGQSRNGTPIWFNAETGEKRYQEKKPGEAREKREASEARGVEILKKVASKKATLEEVAELATHLPVMRLSVINDTRKALEFHFNQKGEKLKKHRIERLLDHVEKKVGKPDFKPRAPEQGREKRDKLAGTVARAVSDFGGIDPHSHEFQKYYSSVKDAVADGIPATAFRHPKGGLGKGGLDALAQELNSAGVLTIPEGRDGGEYVLNLMKKGAKEQGSEGVDDAELEKRLKAFYGEDYDKGEQGTEINDKGYPASWDEPETKPATEQTPATKEEPKPEPVAEQAPTPESEPTPEPKPAEKAPAPATQQVDLVAWSEKALAKAETVEQRKAIVAAGRLGKVIAERGNVDRVLQAYNQATAESEELPDEQKARFLDGIKRALPKNVRAELENKPADESDSSDDDVPEVGKPTSIKDILAADADVLAKRRAKVKPAESKPAEAEKVAEKVTEEVAKPVKKAPPKPTKKPAKPKKAKQPTGVETVRNLADAETDPQAKDYLQSALHNAKADDPADLADQLGSSIEESVLSRKDNSIVAREIPASAQAAVRHALQRLGAKPHGPVLGKPTQYDPRLHQPYEGTRFPGDPVVVVRPPLVIGDKVVSKGVVKNRTVGGEAKPAAPEAKPAAKPEPAAAASSLRPPQRVTHQEIEKLRDQLDADREAGKLVDQMSTRSGPDRLTYAANMLKERERFGPEKTKIDPAIAKQIFTSYVDDPAQKDYRQTYLDAAGALHDAMTPAERQGFVDAWAESLGTYADFVSGRQKPYAATGDKAVTPQQAAEGQIGGAARRFLLERHGDDLVELPFRPGRKRGTKARVRDLLTTGEIKT